MKNRHYLYGIVFLLLASCSLPPEYMGDKFTRTKHIDIYYSVSDIKRPYKVMGHLTGHKYFKEAEEKNLSQMAKSKGADAIIILSDDGSKPVRVHAEALKYN